MNLERRERSIISDLIYGGTVAGIILCLLVQNGMAQKKSRILNHTIPPIIIKSGGGQVEIEYNREMNDPLPISPNVYQILGFGRVKDIEIQYYDSDMSKSPSNKPHPEKPQGIRVEIYLQKLNSITGMFEWEWVADPRRRTPQIIIRGYGTNFEVEVTNPLHRLSIEKNDNKHSVRKFKRTYVGDPNTDYRLGRMEIFRGTQSIPFDSPESTALDHHDFGDQFALGLGKVIVQRRRRSKSTSEKSVE